MAGALLSVLLSVALWQTCLLVISMCTYSYSAVGRERSTDHVEWAVNESMA